MTIESKKISQIADYFKNKPVLKAYLFVVFVVCLYIQVFYNFFLDNFFVFVNVEVIYFD